MLACLAVLPGRALAQPTPGSEAAAPAGDSATPPPAGDSATPPPAGDSATAAPAKAPASAPASADSWGDERKPEGYVASPEPAKSGHTYNWLQMFYASIVILLMALFTYWLVRKNTRDSAAR